MTIQISIIGLDRMGISFGLALRDQKQNLFRCGHDSSTARIKNLDAEDAFDKLFFRLSEAIREADVILLCLPVDQIENTIKEMTGNLKENAILINTAPANVSFFKWAKNHLPVGRSAISMIPTLNGHYLNESDIEGQIPHADLFKNTDMLILSTEDTKPDAVSMVSELTTLVGAHALFVDPLEADGMLAKIDLLPKLAASALLLTTMDQPGWQDTRRIASSLYAKTTNALQKLSEEEHPSAIALANHENALLVLDGLIASLFQIRALIESNDQKALDELLTGLKQDQSEWMDLRTEGNWEKSNDDRLTKPSSVLGKLFSNPLKPTKK